MFMNRVFHFSAIQEYYIMSIYTPASKKYIWNRITWLYFIIRNIIYYGKFIRIMKTLI
jgi:hypothetical protein